MAVSTSCCLNHSSIPPASAPSSLYARTTQVSWPKKEERSWRSQCVLGMACIIIGLEMDNSIAIASENLQPIVESKGKANRWSNKRACLPWRLNSLETIVPEDLPRPSARRRWESIGHPKSAPAVKVIGRTNNNGSCFTL